MHVFLTGDRCVGKSTAVRAVANRLDLPRLGFISDFRPGEHGTKLFLTPADDPDRRDDAHLAAVCVDGKMQAIPGAFDRIGVPLLEQAMQAPKGLVLMDEIGHLERDSAAFRKAVLRCLDGRLPVLGVLRSGQAWHEEIIRHPNVQVLHVTMDNRDIIAERAAALLQDAGKASDANGDVNLAAASQAKAAALL